MQPCLFPKVLYTYTSTSQQWFFVLLQIVIGSQPYQGIQEALYILAPTRSFRNTIFIKNMYSQDSILTYCCPSSIDSFTSLKELCTAVSLKMTLDSCQRYAALPYIRGPYKNDATLCKERCDFMLGMSYSRKKIVLHKACIGGFENKCQRPCWNLFAGYMFKSWLCCISSHGFKSLSGRVPKPWENLFVWFCIVSWMPRQKSNVQTALKNLIVFMVLPMKNIYILGLWPAKMKFLNQVIGRKVALT